MERFLEVQHRVSRAVWCDVLIHAGLERSNFGDLQRGVGEHVKFGLNGPVLVAISVVVVVRRVGHRDLGLPCHDVREWTGDGEETVNVGGARLTGDGPGLTVDHLVVHADASVGQVYAQFVAQLAGDDHRLGNNFTRQRIDFAGVNDLIVDRHNGSTNEVEAVGVVGHGQTEVVVARNRRARVPRTLNTKVGHIKRLAALVGQGFLEPQNNVDRPETIGEEGLGIGSKKRRVERGDVGLQASN